MKSMYLTICGDNSIILLIKPGIVDRSRLLESNRPLNKPGVLNRNRILDKNRLLGKP